MKTNVELLKERAFTGLEERGLHEKQEYCDRLEYELEVIISLGFEAYFLIMQDIMQWAKKRMMTSPGRGSVAGSLLAYALEITEVDPIKHDLMFERFLNPARGSLIDIDSIADQLSQVFSREDKSTNLEETFIQGRLSEDIRENLENEKKELLLKGSEFIGQIVASKREGIKVSNLINSWVLYCSGVTDEKPTGELKRSHGSPPDIDSDFSDKDAVYEYVKEKYGEDYVARVGSWGLLKTKSAIRDVCRILGKPISFADEIAKLVPPPRHGLWISFDDDAKVSPDLLSPKYKEVIDYVRPMCGMLRSYGTHAGGVVISPVPITEVVPVYKDKANNQVTQVDHRTIEDIGLLKFDFLGLSTLRIIEETLRILKKKGIELDLFSIEDGDKKTYELICSGNLDGIFQLCDSAAPITVAFKPQSIEDISVISAVNRPGPSESGLVSQLLEIRNGQRKPSYLHPKLEPILSKTQSICLYQEQVQKMFIELGNYSSAAAENMRKVMGKKKLGEMEKHRERFIKGCKENNIDEDLAAEIFSTIENSASYLFNAAHSCSYSYLSYYTAYLKAYYPAEFYSALLTCENDPDQKIRFAASAREMGLTILPPDINESELNYTPGKNTIRFGLGHIKGVSAKVIDRIISRRKEGEYKSIEDLTQRAEIDIKTAQALGLSGTLLSLETDMNEKEGAAYAVSWVKYWKEWKKAKTKEEKIEEREKENEKRLAAGKKVLKRLTEPTFPVLPVLPKVSYSGREAIALQREMLKMYISGHPLDEVKEKLDTIKIKDLWLLQEFDPCIVRGVLLSCKTMSTKKKEMMAIFRVEDRTKSIEVLAFPKTYTKYKDLLIEGNILEIVGKIKKQESYSDEEFGSQSDIIKIFAARINKIELPSERKNWAIVCPLLKGSMKIEGKPGVPKSFVNSILGF